MISIKFITAAVFCLLYYYFTRTFNYWNKRKVAGPKPKPFFGNLKDSILRRKNVGIVYKEIYDQFPNENVIGFYRMMNPTIIIRNLDIMKCILIKDFDAFSDRGLQFSKERLGDNLLHCDVTTWRALRNHMSFLFTSKKLRNSFTSLNKYAIQIVKYLDITISREEEPEVQNIFQKYTMASTMALFFGINVDFFGSDQRMIENIGSTIFETSYAAEADFLIPNIWNKINCSFFPKLVNKLCYEVVRITTKEKTSDMTNALLALNKPQTTAINAKATFAVTDHVLAGQVFILFAAGFGNNALSLSLAIYHLAKNKDCQDKLIKEIDEVMEKSDGKLTYDALQEMSFLEKVFMETLRINPLTIAIQRSAKRDYTIPGTKFVIEKGITVLASPYAIHRDPNIYPDPDRFDPERFSKENSVKRHSCAYLPFGVGPRSCLGRQIGKLQFFAAITNIFSTFRVESSNKTQTVEDYDPMSILLSPKGGIYVKFIPRKI